MDVEIAISSTGNESLESWLCPELQRKKEKKEGEEEKKKRRNQAQGQQKQRLARSFLTGPFYLVEKAAKGESMLQAMHTRANTPAPGQTLRARLESFDTLLPPQACRREAK